MARTVLIGVDGSRRAADAMAVGALLAPALEAEPAPLYAHPYELEGAGGEHEQQVRSVAETSAHQAQAHLGGSRAPRLELVADRSPARALHAAAEEPDVAAIVVGSSHRGPVGRVLPGGVAQRLLSGAPCPIVVAPAGFVARQPLGLGTIGIGFDGSADSTSALEMAAGLARVNDGPLLVIAVHERIGFGHVPVAADQAATSINQQIRADLSRKVDEAITGLGMADQATATLREGDAATALAKESERLGLVVVGSRGYGPLGSVLLGGVSNRLLSRSACPVMVVPATPAPAPSADAPVLAVTAHIGDFARVARLLGTGRRAPPARWAPPRGQAPPIGLSVSRVLHDGDRFPLAGTEPAHDAAHRTRRARAPVL
jgi:nucleotide-binding universal stress UspA family protein